MPDAPLRVFLVEDHEWLLEVHRALLDREPGVTVCGTATTGEQALAELPPDADAAVVDARLPGISGIDVVRALAERRPDVTTIVLSARPAVEVAAEALAAGAAAYVEKGDVDGLLAALRAVRAPS